MKRFSCTTEKYGALYSRWLENPGALLDFAGYTIDDKLLDLCGGTGAVSSEAIRRGAESVVLLDLNPRCSVNGVLPIRRDVNVLGSMRWLGQFDLVVIRQALGYLDLNALMFNLMDVIAPGGRVVFNTFIDPKWKLSRYTHGTKKFVEMSAPLLGHVLHLQMCTSDNDFDVSHFKWHRLFEIKEAFDRNFTLTRIDNSHTSCRCVYTRV